VSRAKVGDLEIEVEVVRYNRLILHFLVPLIRAASGSLSVRLSFPLDAIVVRRGEGYGRRWASGRSRKTIPSRAEGGS
jgi:hypothetical protein